MFGGVDDWTFDAVTFKEELRKEHDSVWLRDPLGVSPDEGIEVEEEEEEDGEGEGLKESDPGPRQVIITVAIISILNYYLILYIIII